MFRTIGGTAMTPPKHSKYSELDEILDKLSGESFDAAINNPDDYMLVVNKAVAEAKTALTALINKEKAKAELVVLKSLLSPRYLREVTTTMTDTNGGVYQDESNLHISEYEVRERIAELEAQLAKDKE